jgi:hypothetical protein
MECWSIGKKYGLDLIIYAPLLHCSISPKDVLSSDSCMLTPPRVSAILCGAYHGQPDPPDNIDRPSPTSLE